MESPTVPLMDIPTFHTFFFTCNLQQVLTASRLLLLILVRPLTSRYHVIFLHPREILFRLDLPLLFSGQIPPPECPVFRGWQDHGRTSGYAPLPPGAGFTMQKICTWCAVGGWVEAHYLFFFIFECVGAFEPNWIWAISKMQVYFTTHRRRFVVVNKGWDKSV